METQVQVQNDKQLTQTISGDASSAQSNNVNDGPATGGSKEVSVENANNSDVIETTAEIIDENARAENQAQVSGGVDNNLDEAKNLVDEHSKSVVETDEEFKDHVSFDEDVDHQDLNIEEIKVLGGQNKQEETNAPTIEISKAGFEIFTSSAGFKSSTPTVVVAAPIAVVDTSKIDNNSNIGSMTSAQVTGAESASANASVAVVVESRQEIIDKLKAELFEANKAKEEAEKELAKLTANNEKSGLFSFFRNANKGPEAGTKAKVKAKVSNASDVAVPNGIELKSTDALGQVQGKGSEVEVETKKDENGEKKFSIFDTSTWSQKSVSKVRSDSTTSSWDNKVTSEASESKSESVENGGNAQNKDANNKELITNGRGANKPSVMMNFLSGFRKGCGSEKSGSL